MQIILPLYRIKEHGSALNIFHCIKEIKKKCPKMSEIPNGGKKKIFFLVFFFFLIFFFFNPLFLLEVNILQVNPEMVGQSEALKYAAWGWAGSPGSSPDPALPPLLP